LVSLIAIASMARPLKAANTKRLHRDRLLAGVHLRAQLRPGSDRDDTRGGQAERTLATILYALTIPFSGLLSD
jgi:hypothetical protein